MMNTARGGSVFDRILRQALFRTASCVRLWCSDDSQLTAKVGAF